jgi:tetratricopeptide (TPR) repeat protein
MVGRFVRRQWPYSAAASSVGLGHSRVWEPTSSKVGLSTPWLPCCAKRRVYVHPAGVTRLALGAMGALLIAEALTPATLHAQADYGQSLLVLEDGKVCFDKAEPFAERVSRCTFVINNGSLQKSEMTKLYVARAQAYRDNGDDQAALKDFNAAIRSDPRSELAWIARANFYEARSDHLHALEDYGRAISIPIGRDDPVAFDDRGIALSGLARHEEAIADFTRAIVLDPHDLTAHSNRATSYLATKQPALAIADLSEVIRAQPSNGMALYNRGMAYEGAGDLDKALDDYRSAARFQPSYAPAYAALGRLLKAKDPETALSSLNEAIRLDPKSSALRGRAILNLSLDRPAEALRDFDQVIANDSADGVAYLDRGVSKEKLGDLESAIADYTRSIELAPTAGAFVDRGNAYSRLGQPVRALADFDAALLLDPKSVPALVGRANVHYARKWLSASLDDYTRVIEADPHNAAAYFKRGNVHFDQREFSEAFNDYSASLKLDPNQPVVLFNRSLAAARLGRIKDAEKDRRQAIALDPSIGSRDDRTQKGASEARERE